MIDAQWYDEALPEIERLLRDFKEPEVRDRARRAHDSVRSLRAETMFQNAQNRLKAQQPRGALEILKTFPTEGATQELLERVKTLSRERDAESASDKQLAELLSKTAEGLTSGLRKKTGSALVEMLQGLVKAPEAVRGRLAAFEKAESTRTANERFALAISGWAVGKEDATADIDRAFDALEYARDRPQLSSDAEKRSGGARSDFDRLA